jgi:hypothetical protein
MTVDTDRQVIDDAPMNRLGTRGTELAGSAGATVDRTLLETLASEFHYPSVADMIEAQLLAVRALVERLRDEGPWLSLKDCCAVAVTAMTTATTPPERVAAMDLLIRLGRLYRAERPLPRHTASQILVRLRGYLDGLAERGFVPALAGIGGLGLVADPSDGPDKNDGTPGSRGRRLTLVA